MPGNSSSPLRKNNKGFTLIELLVVIGIISVLATLLMANFVGIRQRGRDAQRKSDLRQIQAALELYRSDNSTYPDTPALGTCGSGVKIQSSGGVTYMGKVPCDPLSKTTPYSYTYDSTTNTYVLYACLENANDPERDTNNGGSNTCTSPLESFTVKTP